MWDKVAVLHTTIGDIQFKIFGDQCPKTAENFCTHARLVSAGSVNRFFVLCVSCLWHSSHDGHTILGMDTMMELYSIGKKE